MSKFRTLIRSIADLEIPDHPAKETRMLLLAVSLGIAAFLAFVLTGSIIPADPTKALIFQVFFLMFVFGMFFLEDKFTKPVDAIVNSSAALISIAPVYAATHSSGWIPIMLYAAAVFVVGSANVILASEESHGRNRDWIAKISYELSTFFGRSNVIFSIAFLYAVVTSFGTAKPESWLLILFWGAYLTLFPLKIPHFLEAVYRILANLNGQLEKIGRIARVDNPNLLKVNLRSAKDWHGSLVATVGDGTKWKVLPLFTHVEDAGVVGTGLLTTTVDIRGDKSVTGCVYRRGDDIEEALPVGIVSEMSTIATIRFETWHTDNIREGNLVYCVLGEDMVYYQVADAQTTEEPFAGHRHGFQVVEAHQLGTVHDKAGFRNYKWLPPMNHPVFLAGEHIQLKQPVLSKNEMILGTVPGSNLDVISDVKDMISHHTAILGITGSGKTELSYRIVSKALAVGYNIFCVDITGQYNERLRDMNPRELSINPQNADKLSKLLFAVDARSWKDEQEALECFRNIFIEKIDERIVEFLEGDNSLGMFTMPSISNNRATLYASEVYLSRIFEYAKDHYGSDTKILIVLEEAHTIVPEASTMGLQDFDSKAIIARISQIALQGRKYGVGLMVVAQRTATVSKSVLTQCNTTITFTSRDKTGLEFLSNVYGAEHVSRIPNLAFLEAIVDGKGIKSERPIVVSMPFDESVANLKMGVREGQVESEIQSTSVQTDVAKG